MSDLPDVVPVRNARKPILRLQHVAFGPADAYEVELDARGVEVITVRPDLGEPIPDWREFAAIVAMGGLMSAFEDEMHPWLVREKDLIGSAVRGGLPYWGVCLGAQLLAAGLGAEVYRGPEIECGVRTLELTSVAQGDPVFMAAPARLQALQWHEDTFALPRGARLLAYSKAYRNQAFAWGNAYALQFHLEASSALVEHWLSPQASGGGLPAPMPSQSLPALLGELASVERDATALARMLMGRWLDLVVERPAGSRLEPVIR